MGWTVIPNTAIDLDSPWNTDRATEYRDNIIYEHDRAVRGGTHATGVRLAVARGTSAFSTAFDQAGNTMADLPAVTITFSSGSTDGNPNFSVAPNVYLSLMEDTSGGAQDWFTQLVQATAHVVNASITTTQFQFEVIGRRGTGTAGNLAGVVHWLAMGLVTSGE